MPTKIRLQRKGKKGQPFYHLVVADGRAPRDGRFIEKLGTYNPMTHPATIDINFDRSLYWVQVGAQPTDTARSILSKKGVMLMHHLLKGVKKGALTEEQAQLKLKKWLDEKEQILEQAKKDEELSKKEQTKKTLEEERKINEARAAEIAKKRAKENLKMEAEQAAAEEPAVDIQEDKPAAEATEETPGAEAKETSGAEAKETPGAEAKETPEKEVKAEPKAEEKEESKKEETPEKKEDKAE